MDGNRADDRIATYSSRGPSRLDLVLKPDIVAPGNRVISVDANNSYLDNYTGGTNDIPLSAYCTRAAADCLQRLLLPVGDSWPRRSWPGRRRCSCRKTRR